MDLKSLLFLHTSNRMTPIVFSYQEQENVDNNNIWTNFSKNKKGKRNESFNMVYHRYEDNT